MNFRVRSKAGTTNVRGIDGATTLSEFRKKMELDLHIPESYQKILAGYPPKEVLNSGTDPISAIFSNGDLITLEQSANATNVPTTTPIATVPTASTKTADVPINTPSAPVPTASTNTATSNASSADAPGFVDTKDGGFVLKRVIPDDNSCLFHAVSYVLANKAINISNDLRKLVARQIALDPIEYNEAILGKNPSEYQRWIQQSNSWGGSVELNIFAHHYKCEIMAYDVTRKRGNCFAEDKGYLQRVYLIYDGIHYDCLVWNLLPDNPSQDFDITVFNTKDTAVAEEFQKYMEKEHSSGRFVDEYNYTLKCNDCGQKLIGNKEAVAHAKATGHTNFGQSTN